MQLLDSINSRKTLRLDETKGIGFLSDGRTNNYN